MIDSYMQITKKWEINLECCDCGKTTYTHEFVSNSRSKVIKQARNCGWSLNFKIGEVRCPWHSRKRKEIK